jgi:zinc transport system substrate-binding protein
VPATVDRTLAALVAALLSCGAPDERGALPTFSPTVAQLRDLDRAILYLKVGHPQLPFEAAWLDQLVAEQPRLRVVDSGAGLDYASDEPHVWVSPDLVRGMVASIADALARELPAHADAFAANRRRLEREIEALDEELRALFAPLRGHRFAVFHPAWGALARQYGLVQMAIEQEGKEPSAGQIVELVAICRAAGVRRLLAQPQFDRAAADLVAAEIGAEVVTVDPLAYEWTANLRRAARAIAEAAVP